MSITVRELVTRANLRLELIVSGDLDREIRWVHSSDMPDPAPYLRGDEVVLTAGIWHWHGIAAASFAAGLGRARAAALGFGTNPLVTRVPDELVEACREWSLTLFRVPDDVSFIEIAEEFVEVHQRLRERPLHELLDSGGQFLYSLQAGGGLDGLLRILSGLLARPAAIVRRGRGAVAASDPDAFTHELVMATEAAIGTEPPVRDLGEATAFPVPTGFGDAALLVAGPAAAITVLERAAIDQALAFAAIELQRARAVTETERRFVGELFDLISAGEGQHPAVIARLRSLGLHPDAALVAVCCDVADPEAALATAQHELEDWGQRGALAIRGRRVVGLVQTAVGDDLDALAERLHATLGPGAFIGIGGTAVDSHGLGRSIVQADHACRFARRRRERGIATHDALASHALLLELQDDGVLDVFDETLVRPLSEHDHRHRTELVRTLDLFLGSGGRYKQTADALHLHVNTLRLRLARIEEITKRDLRSMDDRVDLWIALRSRPGAS